MATPNDTCTVEDCDREAKRRGMCFMHYQRWMKTGRTDLDPRPTLRQRFWEKVDKDGPTPSHAPELGQCWQWIGARSNLGYGNFYVEGKYDKAHRVSYTLNVGPIPEGMVIDHICHNKACIRPNHLRPLTNKQNTEHRLGLSSKNTSGATGVWKHRKTWVAQVGHQGKHIRLGGFPTFDEAKKAAEDIRLALFTHYLEGTDAFQAADRANQ